MAVGNTVKQQETENDGSVTTFRSQVSATRSQVRVRRFGFGKSVIRHLSSTQSFISGGRWQPQVAGGGLFHSALHSALNAVLYSVLDSALHSPFNSPHRHEDS